MDEDSAVGADEGALATPKVIPASSEADPTLEPGDTAAVAPPDQALEAAGGSVDTDNNDDTESSDESDGDQTDQTDETGGTHENGAHETDETYETDADDLGELSEDHVGGRRNALPRRVESWRTRSASGAIATALAMGLQQVFEPEKRRPAAVAEAPSDPYSDNDPVTVDYTPDDAEATTVHVKPWLLQKDDPA